jgi:hypothetical protein
LIVGDDEALCTVDEDTLIEFKSVFLRNGSMTYNSQPSQQLLE